MLTKEQIIEKLDDHGAIITEGKASIQLLGHEGDTNIDTYCVFVILVNGSPVRAWINEDDAIKYYMQCR